MPKEQNIEIHNEEVREIMKEIPGKYYERNKMIIKWIEHLEEGQEACYLAKVLLPARTPVP